MQMLIYKSNFHVYSGLKCKSASHHDMSIQPLWRVYPVIMTCHKFLHLGPEYFKITLLGQQ
jgi:hypothetical protein